MPHFALQDYAATIAHEMPNFRGDVRETHAILELTNAIGQFAEFPGGCVAWLRADWASLPWFERADFAAVASLTVRELTTGPVVYIAEVLALLPGQVIHVLKHLTRLPGVEAWAGHRDEGRRWKVQRIRRRHMQ